MKIYTRNYLNFYDADINFNTNTVPLNHTVHTQNECDHSLLQIMHHGSFDIHT
jgi:hypothetical protein